jgi:hypothetical protein
LRSFFYFLRRFRLPVSCETNLHADISGKESGSITGLLDLFVLIPRGIPPLWNKH